jgi:hypothetical protein
MRRAPLLGIACLAALLPGLIGPLFDASQGGHPGLPDSGGLGGQPGFSSGMCGFEGIPGDLGAGGTLTDAIRARHGGVIIRYQIP